VVRAAVRRAFDETLRRNFVIVLTTLVSFAAALAAGTIYNAGRVALSERARDLASLRVLGLTRGEISYILLGELAVLTLAAIPLGVVCGLAVVRLVCFFLNSEMYRIPFVISPHTLGVSVSVVLISALISGALVRRQLDHLDLIAVLKTRE
ncbi:MAG: ABC transporter permease, partial [Planctomycetaceae bacterium]